MRIFSSEKLNEVLDNPIVSVGGVRATAGLSYNGFDKIRKGESVPSANTLVAIADALQKPLDYFFVEKVQYIEKEAS